MTLHAPEEDAAHWRRTRTLAVLVLAAWAVAGLGVFWAVLPLGAGRGLSPGHWYAALATLVLFVLLAFYHGWRQRGIDRASGHGD